MGIEEKPRVRPPGENDLDDAQRRVYEAIVAGPRGDVPGPLGVWLWRPELADRAQKLGAYARYDTCLSPRLSEVAILVTARFWGSEFEWYSHKPIALEAGVSADAVESIRSGGTPVLEADQAVVFEFSKVLLERHGVDDELYSRAVTELGEEGVIDLVGILGYYSLISLTINAFRVPIPEGVQRELST